MDGVSTSSVDQGPVHYLNLEYWFRQIYDLFFGHASATGLIAWFSHLWVWVTIIGYGVALIAIGIITFTVIEIYKLREREKAMYAPIEISHDDSAQHVRWRHIESLMASQNQNDWRQAIIEADIYLDDILGREGYRGATLGDKLKAIERSDLDTLDDAWEAHKVRNDIAHQGSAFALSESLARRTISKYENVFRELHAV